MSYFQNYSTNSRMVKNLNVKPSGRKTNSWAGTPPKIKLFSEGTKIKVFN